MTDKTDMIYDLVKETRDDVKCLNRTVSTINGKQDVISLRVDNIEKCQDGLIAGQKKIKTDLYSHSGDTKKHYNQGYEETFSQKVWRRKDIIAITTVITTVFGYALEYYYGG